MTKRNLIIGYVRIGSSKYPGTCAKCTTRYDIGATIYWRRNSPVFCEACYHELRAEAAPSPSTPFPSPNFDLTCWDRAEAVLPVAHRALLYGPPGTGKTYAAIHNRPKDVSAYAITLTDETPMSELRGHFIRAQSGHFEWHDGPALRAWREGARLVVNEIHKCSPDIEAFLHVILDDPDSALLMLPTGESVTPHPSFSAVCTMNGDPADLEEALLDRLVVRIECDSIHPSAIATLSPDLRDLALSTSQVDDPHRRLSIRAWLEFDRLRQSIDPAMAALVVFEARAEELLSNLSLASVLELSPNDKGAWGDFAPAEGSEKEANDLLDRIFSSGD